MNSIRFVLFLPVVLFVGFFALVLAWLFIPGFGELVDGLDGQTLLVIIMLGISLWMAASFRRRRIFSVSVDLVRIQIALIATSQVFRRAEFDEIFFLFVAAIVGFFLLRLDRVWLYSERQLYGYGGEVLRSAIQRLADSGKIILISNSSQEIEGRFVAGRARESTNRNLSEREIAFQLKFGKAPIPSLSMWGPDAPVYARALLSELDAELESSGAIESYVFSWRVTVLLAVPLLLGLMWVVL
ncbi:hypothetical protein PVT68_07935 [Microbulbifer bruguierae]|uniref:Uncharacterized protein n=1 Tax=Microbulbifer bruguierae TaxID=3029061 RepID=A0ABY8NKS7_9GAMM|nr:hypothetical protein [Microbulbifer bruguierae]WGL18213.1 hypothetical protein PVT68_07935 [Microbulbifer bruguierae]